MKRHILLLLLAAFLFPSCRQQTKEFTTHNLTGDRCYLQIFGHPIFDDIDTIGIGMMYDIAWPDEGLMSPQALRELQYLCFLDSTSSLQEAIANWFALGDDCFFDDEDARLEEVSCEYESMDGYSNFVVTSTCHLDGELAVFEINKESNHFHAAHGIYSLDNLTVDIQTGDVVHLADLVTDTNLLCEAIAHAIQDLEVNRDTRECLFDEFKDVDRMPLPSNFSIDSARNSITVYYALYEITCYACGIQEVVLPIFWLSKHVPLTPYAKQLFGRGSHLE